MNYKLEDVQNVGKKTAEMMRLNGINSVEELASIDINELIELRGIGRSSGKNIIQNAKLILKIINKDKEKEIIQFEKNKIETSSLKPSENIIDNTDNKFHELNDSKKKIKGKIDHSERTQIIERRIKQEKFEVEDQKKSLENVVIKSPKIESRDFNKRLPPKEIFKSDNGRIDNEGVIDIFSSKTIQRIRFLHHRIKQIEQIIYKDYKNFLRNELSLFFEYIDILNINYKNRNHNLILKELGITQTYYDPINQKNLPINDIMYECTRVSWVLAKIYVFLSENFEKEENLENAIIAMVKASKMYKTAAYFSSSTIYQKEKGRAMEAETLELESEESRILAQGIAAFREERNNNLLFASNLYSGLSVLSKRLYYLKEHTKKKKWKIEAKINYDMGKAFQMKVIAMLNIINKEENYKESLKTLRKLHIKANYYFSKAKEIWEMMMQNLDDLLEEEKEILKFNLSIVKEKIIETEVENADYNEIKDVQDCEPIIIIPENFSLIVPKSFSYLRKYPPKDGNVKRIKRYRNLTFNSYYSSNNVKDLLNIKTAIGRTIKQIKVLYDNNDIEVDKYVELLEKYNFKQTMINEKIKNLQKSTIKPKKPQKIR